MDLSVIFLGTGGSVPSARRSTASVLIARGGDRLLFDCGEGTQRQMQRSIGLTQVDEIYLTHFHADHILGLPGLLKTYDLTDRERPLVVYGPPGLKQLFATSSR
jgi:ribonuclease Z